MEWSRRFTAPVISEVDWAVEAPDRVGVVSTQDGTSQAWCWDLATGVRRRASTTGAEEVHVLPDGSGLVWWLDPIGDERGLWMRTPFDEGAAVPLFPTLPDAWAMGISLASSAVALGFGDEDGYRIIVAHGDDEEPREIYRSDRPAGIGREWEPVGAGLSADARLVVIRHAEVGSSMHPSLRVLDARTGVATGDQRDPGSQLAAVAWSPVVGDRRLLLLHERPGIERPAVWDLSDGSRRDLPLPDLPGPAEPLGWTPGADAILVHHQSAGRQQLLRLDPDTGSLETLVDIAGTIARASYRPNGELWYLAHSSIDPPTVRSITGEEPLSLGTDPPPSGRPMRPIAFTGTHGGTIHGYLVAPDGPGPFPTIVSVHGGPEYHETDAWDPKRQAYVDAGFAVVLVNYRGSTGYGRDHREWLQGNVGFPETEDCVAGLDHAIALGVADPHNAFIEGWSWGGYIANLAAGLHPDRWRGVVAGIPTGDSIAAHYESAPAIRAWEVAIMGGTPMELPELYRERNPMTYADRITAPVLLIAGENDSRCPLGQVMVFAHALAARGHPVQVHVYPGGHHANDVAEQVRHVELTVEFCRRNLG